jgi:hypothetical protein
LSSRRGRKRIAAREGSADAEGSPDTIVTSECRLPPTKSTTCRCTGIPSVRVAAGFRISRGQLRKLIGKVTHSLQDPFEELLRLLPQEDQLNVDETGHKDNGKRLWTWCFRATMFTLFKISPSRGSDVLLELHGKEFDGVLGCDYFSAYRKYMRLNENVSLQF